MATHSSIFAWRIPWTEEPGGLVHGVTELDTTYHSCKRWPMRTKSDILFVFCLFFLFISLLYFN